MVPQPGSIPCRIAKNMGDCDDPGYPRHRPFCPAALCMATLPPGTPCIGRPLRCSGLASKLAHAAILSA